MNADIGLADFAPLLPVPTPKPAVQARCPSCGGDGCSSAGLYFGSNVEACSRCLACNGLGYVWTTKR